MDDVGVSRLLRGSGAIYGRECVIAVLCELIGCRRINSRGVMSIFRSPVGRTMATGGVGVADDPGGAAEYLKF